MCNHQGHHSGRKGRCRTWPSFCNYICHISPETESATPTTLAHHASLTKCPQIYRELFALPTSLSRLQAERQPLILCVSAVKPAHPPLQSPKNPQNSGDQHAAIWLETKCPQIYRELFALPTSLSRLQAERQPLILCVSAVKPAHPPLQSPKNPQNSGDQHAAIWLETKCPQIYRELFALPTSLSRLQAERQPLILCVSAVKPAHPPLQSPKNPQNSGDQHAAIWLEASFEGPPPTPSTPFSASLKMNLSVLYIVLEVGAWSNADLRNYQ